MRLLDQVTAERSVQHPYHQGQPAGPVHLGLACDAGPVIVVGDPTTNRGPYVVCCNRPAGHTGQHTYGIEHRPRIVAWVDDDMV
ncbi:hypothetical protein [Mycobacterium sp.]|uniref:hypothetical protein n=1 Tax=Mycobacterium sp. TaxID=1785 RepID=UPI0031D55CF3